MSRYISRDPFARQELHRTTVFFPTSQPTPSCSWCGQYHVTKKANRRYLFVYSVERDGLYTKPEAIKGQFCSIGCMRSYNQ